MDIAETKHSGRNNNFPQNSTLRQTEDNGANSGSSSQRSAYTWFPYEHSDPSYQCKLNCFSREAKEYYQTGENVIDGTPCTYDNPTDVCVQGKCIKLGCDKVKRYGNCAKYLLSLSYI